MCPLCVLCCAFGVLGHLAPVHRFAHSVRCVVRSASLATWLLLTGVHARCVALCVRCPWPLGFYSRVCPPGVLCRAFGVLGHLVPVQRCARSSAVCAVSLTTWLLFSGVPAGYVVLCVRCPRPLGSRSLVCLLGLLCRAFGVLGHLAPLDQCARSVCSVRSVLGQLPPA